MAAAGRRGLCQVIRTAIDETVLFLQIESRQAYENLDEIIKVPGFDGLFVGPFDLSASLGVITQIRNPAVQEILQEVPRRLAQTGIAAGTILLNMDMEEMAQKIEWGYRFVSLPTPLSYGVQTLNQNLTNLRNRFVT